MPGSHRPRFDTPPQFGPPAGFSLPGGPKLPGPRGDVRTLGAFWLSVVATVVFAPLGIAALVLIWQARYANERGLPDAARDKVRVARAAAAVALLVGSVAWSVVLTRWVGGLVGR